MNTSFRMGADRRRWQVAGAALLLLGAAASLLALERGAPGPQRAGEEEHDSPTAGEEWMYEQRAYPLGHLADSAAAELARAAGETGTEARATSGKQWTPLGSGAIGSALVGGTVQAIAIDPSRPDHWVVGAREGGIWESRDAGATWQARTDDAASLSVGAVAFAPSNPAIVYAGTQSGLLKSGDGGTAWTVQAGATFSGSAFTSLIVDPSNPNLLVAAIARGRYYRPGGPTGVFRSTDGGSTWTLALSGEATALVASPASPNDLYAGIGYSFGSPANGLFRSRDEGQTWSRVAEPWSSQAEGAGALSLAIAPSAAATMYVAVEDQRNGTGHDGSLLGVWRTDGAWASTPAWTRIPTTATDGSPSQPGYCRSQCAYDNVLLVDRADPETLYAAGMDAWTCSRCTGTASWTRVKNQVFGDYHALLQVGGQLIGGNDGGVWTATETLGKAANGNINALLFYHGSVHPADPETVMGGTQDQGIDSRSRGASSWARVKSCDGGDTAFSRAQPASRWAMVCQSGQDSQDFALFRTLNGGATLTPANSGIDGTGAAWLPPLRICPANDDVFLAGSDNLWKTTSFFAAAGPQWVANGPEMGRSISAIAFAPSDPACATYAFATRDGQLRLTTDGGQTWRDIDATNRVPNRWVTGLAFDPSTSATLYVTLSGFADATPGQPGHLFRCRGCTAASASWEDISPPVDIPHNTVAVDPLAPTTLYVGTDVGVWRSFDAGRTWGHMGPAEGMPNVIVNDIVLHGPGRKAAAFTFGRGAFSLDIANDNPVLVSAPARVAVAASVPLTAVVRDASGVPVPDGTNVTFAATGCAGATIDPASAATVAGVATTGVKAGGVGACLVTASAGGLAGAAEIQVSWLLVGSTIARDGQGPIIARGITGRVTNSAGLPYAGVSVWACPVPGGVCRTRTVTDANGFYALQIAAGDYQVGLGLTTTRIDAFYSAPGSGPGTRTVVTVGSGPVNDIDVSLPFP